MMRFSILFVVLFAFWILLSGQLDNHYLMGAGVLCCLVVAWVGVRMGPVDEAVSPLGFVLRLPRYLPWLMWQVALSNIDVALRVLAPRPRIDPQMIRVPHRLHSPLGITTFANSITMTPGTVTVDVGDDSMLVHALHRGAAESLRQGAMLERVAVLEGAADDAAENDAESRAPDAQGRA